MLPASVLDLSHYQVPDNVSTSQRRAWMVAALQKAKTQGGIKLAILKASEGPTIAEDDFPDWVAAAKTAGLEVAAYHFLRPGDMNAQGDRFASLVVQNQIGPVKSDLGIPRAWADWEDPGVKPDDVAMFAQRVQMRLGEAPGVYGGAIPKAALAGVKHPVLSKLQLWLSQYAAQPQVPSPTWSEWVLWQFTDSKSNRLAQPVPGFEVDSTNLDVSHYAGDRLGGGGGLFAGIAGAVKGAFSALAGIFKTGQAGA